MKKYAIIIGENNEETSAKVQKALFAAGFKWYTGVPHREPLLIVLNTFGDGRMAFGYPFLVTNSAVPSGTTMLTPSYVIAHAAELDGAKKPWEVAPEGKKILTYEERKGHAVPGDLSLMLCRYNYDVGSNSWFDQVVRSTWSKKDVVCAVPLDFVFEPGPARYLVDITDMYGDVLKFVGGESVSFQANSCITSEASEASMSDYISSPNTDCFEIQEADLPYLKKPVALRPLTCSELVNWEFRKPQDGDTTMAFYIDTAAHSRVIDWSDNDCTHHQDRRFGGYRWCQPKKAEEVVEMTMTVKIIEEK